MTTKKSGTTFPSEVTEVKELQNFYVYIVALPFYGYTDANATQLKLYDRNEVEQKVKEAFRDHVFVEPSITHNTNLLIVPDNWNRRLPKEASVFAPKLSYLPFSYVLYPGETNPVRMQKLMAPVDAPFQYAKQESKREKETTGTFLLSKVTPDNIMKQFQGWRYDMGPPTVHMLSSTPSMHAHASRSHSTSSRKKSASSWSAKAEAMQALQQQQAGGTMMKKEEQDAVNTLKTKTTTPPPATTSKSYSQHVPFSQEYHNAWEQLAKNMKDQPETK